QSFPLLIPSDSALCVLDHNCKRPCPLLFRESSINVKTTVGINQSQLKSRAGEVGDFATISRSHGLTAKSSSSPICVAACPSASSPFFLP
ncbi:hypothetical protein S245_005136, partial [Arachis hypogaea]